MKHRIEYFFFIVFSSFFQILGLNFSRRLSGFLAFIFYYLVPVRKKTVVDNLKLAFPEYDSASINKMAFAVYRSVSITIIEILTLPKLKRDQVDDIIESENPDLLIKKIKENRGVILLSAHFANWEYAALLGAVHFKIPFTVIVKTLGNPYVYEWMNKIRTKWNNDVVQLGVSIKKIYQALKQKKLWLL